MQLSLHFSLAQLTYSEVAEKMGIDNSPAPDIVENLKQLASELERVQALLGTPLDVARAMRQSDIDFDQCILEYGRWVHLSFSDAPRGRVLTIYDEKDGYLAGLWDEDGNRVA